MGDRSFEELSCLILRANIAGDLPPVEIGPRQVGPQCGVVAPLCGEGLVVR